MKNQRAEQLLDTAARRRLSANEQAEWDALLGQCATSERAPWEDEMRLNRVLGTLIQIPVSSNFTTRVLGALERELRRGDGRRAAWLRWLPLLRWRWQWAAGSVAILLLTAVTLQQGQRVQARQDVVHSAGMLAEAGNLPSLEMLRDFDAIYALPGGPLPSATDLTAAFEQSVP